MKNVYTIRRKSALIAIFCLLFFIALFPAARSASALAHADGAESEVPPPAELIVTFESDEEKTERSGDVSIADGKAVLKNGGAVKTKQKFGALRLYVSAKIEGVLKITLGNAAIVCGENGFSSIGAAETYSDGRELRGETLIALTLWGRNIEIGVKAADEPQERLYNAAFKAVLAQEREEKIYPSFSAESGTIEIGYFEVFSLEPSVPGESENYDPSHDSSAFAVKPVKAENAGKKGCSSSIDFLSAGAAAIAACGVVGAAAMRKARKSKKAEEKNDEKNMG